MLWKGLIVFAKYIAETYNRRIQAISTVNSKDFLSNVLGHDSIGSCLGKEQALFHSDLVVEGF